MRILFVTSVKKEADAIGSVADAQVIVSGVGRVNAACATTETILRHGPFDLVINAGVAGALPVADSDEGEAAFAASIGELVVASTCSYMEEGLITPEGFQTIDRLGFALGDFAGNQVPVDARMVDAARRLNLRVGPIATVATCSGTDNAARNVARRTSALAEAMEGAAVVHAARRLNVAAGEIRAISNTTGDRSRQTWALAEGLSAIGEGVRRLVEIMREVL